MSVRRSLPWLGLEPLGIPPPLPLPAGGREIRSLHARREPGLFQTTQRTSLSRSAGAPPSYAPRGFPWTGTGRRRLDTQAPYPHPAWPPCRVRRAIASPPCFHHPQTRFGAEGLAPRTCMTNLLLPAIDLTAELKGGRPARRGTDRARPRTPSCADWRAGPPHAQGARRLCRHGR